MAIDITNLTTVSMEDEFNNMIEIQHDEGLDSHMISMSFSGVNVMFSVDVIDDVISGLEVVKKKAEGCK